MHSLIIHNITNPYIIVWISYNFFIIKFNTILYYNKIFTGGQNDKNYTKQIRSSNNMYS